MTTSKQQQRSGKNHIWIIPIVSILILVFGVGGYYVYGLYDQYQTEQSQILESSIQESSHQSELASMHQILDRDVFYAGIFIDDLDLSGKSYEEIKAELQKRDETYTSEFAVNLKFEDQTFQITASEAGISSDWQAVLDQAWQTGRTSSQSDEEAALRDRYAVVESLQKTPLRLTVNQAFDQVKIADAVNRFTDSLQIEAVGAKAKDFDLSAKTFVIEEQKTGRSIDGEAVLEEVLGLLKQGKMGETVTIQAKTVTVGMDKATMQSHLGLVSKAVTYAKAVNVNRDSNIKLICKMLNGLVIQPGETFSFNGYIGERTAAKGFKAAGGIKDGVLIEELGGGICQPNTTLCHAVLMADLEIVERHPHSWPSAYVPVGLDATVSWKGPDFKFRNDTEYPVAIVAWYSKPSIVFQVYGRKLETGVSISLEAVHNGYIQEAAPKETYNPDLNPGERVEIRAPHTGQRATAYKIWKKDGKVIKREEIFKSYYRPIQGLYEYGPAKAPAPTATPTPPELSPTPAA